MIPQGALEDSFALEIPLEVFVIIHIFWNAIVNIYV